jgi:hypothetical protein
MYLELRQRPMSREHARPQPPAGRRRYGGGADEPAPVPVGVTGHRTQRPRGQVGPPGPHPAQPSSSLDPGGERRPVSPPLGPLIAQLVVARSAGQVDCGLAAAGCVTLLCWEKSAKRQARGPAFGIEHSTWEVESAALRLNPAAFVICIPETKSLHPITALNPARATWFAAAAVRPIPCFWAPRAPLRRRHRPSCRPSCRPCLPWP